MYLSESCKRELDWGCNIPKSERHSSFGLNTVRHRKNILICWSWLQPTIYNELKKMNNKLQVINTPAYKPEM